MGAIGLASLPAVAIKYKGDLEADESLTLPEQSVAPGNPAPGNHKLYFKDDGIPYSRDSSGNENPIDRAGFKNFIINGNFDLWQRGTSFTVSGDYTADRWKQNHNTGGAVYSRQAFPLGQVDVPGEPKYYMQVQVISPASATSSVLRYRVEGVSTLAGQIATFSFWAKCDSPKSFDVSIDQIFGTGGSPSPPVGAAYSSVAIGTVWSRYSVTASMNSLAGKSLGSNNDDYIEIHLLETGSFSNFTLSFAQAQFEKGSTTTEFEKRPISMEVLLAQRYFEKSFPLTISPVEGFSNPPYSPIMTISSTVRRGWISFKTRKRNPPVMKYYKAAGMANNGNWNVREDESSWTERTVATHYANESGAVIQVEAAGAVVGQGLTAHGHWTADAEL